VLFVSLRYAEEMDDIDQLLDDLRNATVSNVKQNELKNLQIKEEEIGVDDIYEEPESNSSLEELDNLLNELRNEKLNLSMQNSSQSSKRNSENTDLSLSKKYLIINVCRQACLFNTNFILSSLLRKNVDVKLEASLAAKELEDILNSVSSYKVIIYCIRLHFF
jgi:hypothetical protein